MEKKVLYYYLLFLYIINSIISILKKWTDYPLSKLILMLNSNIYSKRHK